MDVGMMWFNDSPKTPLATKVAEAAEYYRTKYGQTPNLCLVHPSIYEQVKLEDGPTITIRSARYILPGHMWIGREEVKK